MSALGRPLRLGDLDDTPVEQRIDGLLTAQSPTLLISAYQKVRQARDAGVRFAIDTDAHSFGDLENMKYGVGTAQRGWLTSDDVINTWPLEQLREFLRKGRAS